MVDARAEAKESAALMCFYTSQIKLRAKDFIYIKTDDSIQPNKKLNMYMFVDMHYILRF